MKNVTYSNKSMEKRKVIPNEVNLIAIIVQYYVNCPFKKHFVGTH